MKPSLTRANVVRNPARLASGKVAPNVVLVEVLRGQPWHYGRTQIGKSLLVARRYTPAPGARG